MTCIRPSLRGTDPPEPWQPQPAPRPQPFGPRLLHILIAEDDEDVRHILRRTLEDAGHEVLSASDGLEALDVLGSPDAVDLLITDILMPRMSGYALGSRLRGLRPDLPIIYVSGYAVGWDKEVEAGPNTVFLQKPYSEQDLLSAIARLSSSPD